MTTSPLPRDAAYARTELSSAALGQSGPSGQRGSRAWLAPVAVVLCLAAASAVFFAVRRSGVEATLRHRGHTRLRRGPLGLAEDRRHPRDDRRVDPPPIGQTATPTTAPAAPPTAPAPGSGKVPPSKPTARPVTTVPKHHDDGI